MSESAGLQSFLAELKRRRVFRVMAVYGVVGFIVLQVVDLAIPALLLPGWTYRLAALILAIGLPVAIILAWAFEMTPDGVRRTREATPEELERIAAAPASSRWPIGLAALAGAVLLALGTWWMLGRSAGAAADAREYDSIAVLPFVNMTGQEGVEYMGDGLAEELRNALVRIEGLKVPSMTDATALRESGADIRTIGDSLDVDLVLEGSVRGADDQLRVTAQLIDATDGYHVWSNTYEKPVGNLLELQKDLTEQIVRELSNRLEVEDVRSVASGGTDSAAAYDYYLRGRHFWNKRRYPDMQVAIGLFEKAIAIDSAYAPAYAAIADAYVVPTGWGDDPKHALDEGIRYAERALELDPTLAEAHNALAYARMMRDLAFRQAEQGFARAIELDPDYATAHQWFSELLSAIGRHEEAVREVQRAEELDPTPIIRWNVTRVLYFAGRYEEVLERADAVQAEELGSERMASAYQFLSLLALERYDDFVDLATRGASPGPRIASSLRDSIAAARTRPNDSPTRFIARYSDAQLARQPEVEADPRAQLMSASLWARAGSDTALTRLENAFSGVDGVQANVAWFDVLVDPAFDSLRDDPRYLELAETFPR